MRVYRVMDDEGNGPYNGGLYYDYSEHFNDNKGPLRPSPVKDLPNGEWSSLNVFGFATIKQVCTWFDAKRRDWLKAHGFRVAAMELPEADVIKGGHQVAFPAFEAQLIKALELDELEPEQ